MKANVVSRVVAVIGCVALSVTVAHAGSGQGGGGGTGFDLSFLCYVIQGANQTRVVELNDQFQIQTNVRVETARLLCMPVIGRLINERPDLDPLPADADHYKCYTISNTRQPLPVPVVQLTDQFGLETVGVNSPALLCMPAAKETTP